MAAVALFACCFALVWHTARSFTGRRGAARPVALAALPDLIEALALCTEAGLDPLHALERMLDVAPADRLTAELRRTLAEAGAGLAKAEAWRRLAERNPHEEIRLFVGMLVQAEMLGASPAAGLRGLAGGIRERRFREAERRALEAPVKLLLPMACSFLAIFVLIGGALYLDFTAPGGMP